MHTRARDYKKLVHEANAAKIKKGKQPKEGDVVEMNNFQEPQLSTDRPLVRFVDICTDNYVVESIYYF